MMAVHCRQSHHRTKDKDEVGGAKKHLIKGARGTPKGGDRLRGAGGAFQLFEARCGTKNDQLIVRMHDGFR